MLQRILFRGQAILLALTLVALPLVLLAQPSLHGRSACNGMCCRPRKTHSMPTLPASPASAEARLSCHRGDVEHISMCIVPSHRQEDQLAMAPLPPVNLLEEAGACEPQLQDEELWTCSDRPSTGFVRTPFEPPRN